jgi:hypothetical protein
MRVKGERWLWVIVLVWRGSGRNAAIRCFAEKKCKGKSEIS